MTMQSYRKENFIPFLNILSHECKAFLKILYNEGVQKNKLLIYFLVWRVHSPVY